MSEFPRLLRGHDHRWGYNHETGIMDTRLATKDMCDYGAEQFRGGICDLVCFNCMQHEVEEIRAYMAANHPTVAFTCGNPKRVLNMAIEDWKKQNPAPIPRAPAPAHSPKEQA